MHHLASLVEIYTLKSENLLPWVILPFQSRIKSINWFLTPQGFGSHGLLYSVTLFKLSLSFCIFVYFIEKCTLYNTQVRKEFQIKPRAPDVSPQRTDFLVTPSPSVIMFVWLPDYSISPRVCDGMRAGLHLFVYYFIPRLWYSLWSIVHIQERQLNKLLKSKGKQNWSWVLRTGERTEIPAGWGKDTK